MSEEEIIDYQISSIIGHRPTWKSGTNPQANYFSNFARKMGVLLMILLIFLMKRRKTKQKRMLEKNIKNRMKPLKFLNIHLIALKLRSEKNLKKSLKSFTQIQMAEIIHKKTF
jgi:hypothetical protein